MENKKTKEELTAEYEEMLKKSQKIDEMTLTEGWKILEAWITNHFDSAKENLLTCPDEEIKEGRGYAKAYKSVLKQVEKWIEEGNRAAEKIRKLSEKS